MLEIEIVARGRSATDAFRKARELVGALQAMGFTVVLGDTRRERVDVSTYGTGAAALAIVEVQQEWKAYG